LDFIPDGGAEVKKTFVILFAASLALSLAGSVLPWQLNLEGAFIYRFDVVAQGGRAGFFGAYDTGAPALFVAGGPNWAAQNAWVGARNLNAGQSGTQFGVVTGTNASFNYQRMEFYPEIRLNQSMRLRGVYQIGAHFFGPQAVTAVPAVVGPFGPLEYGWYQNSSRFGAFNPIDSGSWTQWWLTAQIPWGIIVFGKRPAPFGTGVQYVGSNVTAEGLDLVVPYGPFRFGVGVYLHRRQTWLNAARNGILELGNPFALGTARNISFFDGGTFPKQWDRGSDRTGEPTIFLTYSSGDFDFGALYSWMKTHDGPEARTTWGDAAQGQSLTTVTRDETLEHGSVYFKYYNGQFFFNAELAWGRAQITYQLPQTMLGATPVIPGGGGSPVAPQAIEVWKFGTEFGAVVGPFKISLLYSWVPGPDRRHGIWISKQSWENAINGAFLGNSPYFRPYSLLMAYQYGAGLNALDKNGEGYMTDAVSYGARLDYALAANLNFYASWFYADRQSHGWGWGCLAPDGGANVVLLGRSNEFGQYVPATNNSFVVAGPAAAAPSIPDPALGWEVSAGLDWKLLETFQLELRGAYWQPGNWFKYACVDKSQVVSGTVIDGHIAPVATDGAAIGSGWGVNPGRRIDPIWGLQSGLRVDF
jgi:hypothetical protein